MIWEKTETASAESSLTKFTGPKHPFQECALRILVPRPLNSIEPDLQGNSLLRLSQVFLEDPIQLVWMVKMMES